jgi:asparagine synthase (glutamine-hydrolysing)
VCGISVVFDPGGSAADGVDALQRMHASIPHRGPDGEGFLVLDARGSTHSPPRLDAIPRVPIKVGVAFRRLKVLDLSSAAAQPMPSPDGTCWIAFNGEIYNYRDLRSELAARGRSFRSTGDTEVALAAYEAWGEEAFARLEGMWAIVVMDLRRRRLVVSRDRFGIKPLYWTREGEALLLASEIRQILAARGEAPRVNGALLRRYLAGARLPCLDETFFDGLQPVPAASWTAFPLDAPLPDRPSFRRFWDLPDGAAPPPRPAYGDAVDGLRQRLDDALRSHDDADVTVGSLLSGGLDSAALVGLLAPRRRALGRPFPTFSFGVRDLAPELCELGYVDAFVRRDGLVNHQAGLDAAWAVENAPRMVRALEEPPLAMPALAQYRVFQSCREHGATVVLDGQGADEILAGYPYHQRTLLADRLERLRLRDFGREVAAIARRQRRSALSVIGEAVWPPLAARVHPAPGWLDRAYGPPDEGALGAARADRGHDPSRVNRQIRYDVKWGNVKIMLGYTDKSAMAHSVEARVPYFDRRLVEFALALPDSFKVGAGERKRILRDVARAVVPPEITERPDRLGFGVPQDELLRDGMWPAVREAIHDEGVLAWPCFVPAPARRFVDDFGAGRHRDARTIWRFYALALWARAFAARPR